VSDRPRLLSPPEKAGPFRDAEQQRSHGDLLGHAQRELSWMHGPLIYMTRARLCTVLFDYIEIFYNRERAQSGLDHLSPLDYEAAIVVA
jgi:transposase InsO family protein